jgi:hypothetical protein
MIEVDILTRVQCIGRCNLFFNEEPRHSSTCRQFVALPPPPRKALAPAVVTAAKAENHYRTALVGPAGGG